jgi:hypothetical protein
VKVANILLIAAEFMLASNLTRFYRHSRHMDYLLPSTAVLTEALKLIEQKQSIETQLKSVSAKLTSLGGAKIVKIALPKLSKIATVKVKDPKKARKVKPAQSGQGTGKLKDRVITILKSAGSSGIAVPDLASTLQIKPVNIHVFFSTTGKKNPSIQKIGRGIYAWKASDDTTVKTQPAAKRPKIRMEASIPPSVESNDEPAAVELNPTVQEAAPPQEPTSASTVETSTVEVQSPAPEERVEPAPVSSTEEPISEQQSEPLQEQQELLPVDGQQGQPEHHA